MFNKNKSKLLFQTAHQALSKKLIEQAFVAKPNVRMFHNDYISKQQDNQNKIVQDKIIFEITGKMHTGHHNNQEDNGSSKNESGNKSYFSKLSYSEIIRTLFGTGIILQFVNEARKRDADKISNHGKEINQINDVIEKVVVELQINRCRFREDLQSTSIAQLETNLRLLRQLKAKLILAKNHLDNISWLRQGKIAFFGGNIKDINAAIITISKYENRVALLEYLIQSWIKFQMETKENLTNYIDHIEKNINDIIRYDMHKEYNVDILPAFYNLQAFFCLKCSDYNKAIKYFEEAYKISDDVNRAYIDINVARTMGKLTDLYKDKSRERLVVNCLDLIKNSQTLLATDKPYVLYHYAILLALNGEKDEAKLFFERAALNYQCYLNGKKPFNQLESADVVAQTYFAQFLINEFHDYKRVVQDLKNLDALEQRIPVQGSLFYQRAVANYNLGRYKEALADIQMADMLMRGKHSSAYRKEKIQQAKLKIQEADQQKANGVMKSELYNWTSKITPPYSENYFNNKNLGKLELVAIEEYFNDYPHLQEVSQQSKTTLQI